MDLWQHKKLQSQLQKHSVLWWGKWLRFLTRTQGGKKPVILITKTELVQSIIVAKIPFFTTHIEIVRDRRPS